ncbi:MAG: aminoglycoside phosphotransferase family protein [Micrococcales bacterium]|nr:aminoglycoside phosphotransferase family protein [Micrococcales bacterium]
MSDDGVDPPQAFSGQRLDWRDLPVHVRRRIATLAGAEVTAETSATSGFSPGFVAVLETADGRAVFVKAVSPRENPRSPELARAEIRHASAMPDEILVPRLLWWDDDGEWVVSGWEAVSGRTPQIPWQADELRLVLDAIDRLAQARPRPGHALPTTPELLREDFAGWTRIASADPGLRDRLVATFGDDGRWAVENLDALVRWEEEALQVLAGDHLVHGDLRSDNVMLDEQHQVWVIDWPHASVGAPWLDLAFMLPSVAAEGGGDPAAIFAAHPVGAAVEPEPLRAALAGLTGYLTWSGLQPDPPGLPNLRAFQTTQARTSLSWLRTLA